MTVSTTGQPVASLRPVPSPRHHHFGFWAATWVFLAVLAFSTAPSPLYVLYADRDHFSSLMVTIVFAAYAVGVVASLSLASHLSDVHGRRVHLLAAVCLSSVSAVVFIFWPGLAGLFVARVLTGVAVGLTVSTATAYLSELHTGHRPGTETIRRPQLAAAGANFGGLGLGGLCAGLLAQYAPHPLVLPYLVLLAALVIGAIALIASPETRHRPRPLPPYRPQRVSVPIHARPQYFGLLVEVFVAYAGVAIFLGLAGTFLATVIGDTSLAMAGLAIFIACAVGIVALVATGTWPVRRLLVVGLPIDLAGLAMVVVAAWLPTPSLGLFLAGGGVIGAGAAILYKGTLGSVVAISPPDKLGESLSGFFLAGYVGLSLPAVAGGIALQYLTPRTTLLVLGAAAGIGVLGSSWLVLRKRA
ncbi:MFS transporter [Streptomyces sp. NPDC008139]|uniref:MFS transporter n=1 Tax=Streptomyces sp. NPDC008139 TaxID=3364814 RepID=UPI0036ECE31F